MMMQPPVSDVLQEIVKIGMVFPDSGKSDPGIALGRPRQRDLLRRTIKAPQAAK
jgi:hypothetical protein